MSHLHSHIKSALKFLKSADSKKPAALQLKAFFSADKKYGSKDRRSITSLVYGYYRLGKAMPDASAEDRLIAAYFLFNDPPDDSVLPENLKHRAGSAAERKLKALKIAPADIFPVAGLLSDEIDADEYAASFLTRPAVFIRPRPGKELKVASQLDAAGIEFTEKSTTCFAVAAEEKIEDALKLNEDAVIQDMSSAKVFDHLKRAETFVPDHPNVWDCCAASGGKSILLYDLLHGRIELTVSDVRAAILNTLKKRFHDAGIRHFKSFVADLTTANAAETGFDIVICDAPCTGSGTWARTPEALFHFKPGEEKKYAQKQSLIAQKAADGLKPNGFLFYITCSVFAAENEGVIAQLNGIKLLGKEYIKGYHDGADTLFVAVLQK